MVVVTVTADIHRITICRHHLGCFIILSNPHATSMKGFLFSSFPCKLGTQAQKGELAFPKSHSWLPSRLGSCIPFCVGFHLTPCRGVTGCQGNRYWVSRCFPDAEALTGCCRGTIERVLPKTSQTSHMLLVGPLRGWVPCTSHLDYSSQRARCYV